MSILADDGPSRLLAGEANPATGPESARFASNSAIRPKTVPIASRAMINLPRPSAAALVRRSLETLGRVGVIALIASCAGSAAAGAGETRPPQLVYEAGHPVNMLEIRASDVVVRGLPFWGGRRDHDGIRIVSGQAHHGGTLPVVRDGQRVRR